jgi:hypothetical protein
MFPSMGCLWLASLIYELVSRPRNTLDVGSLLWTLVSYALLALGFWGLLRRRRAAWKWVRRVAWLVSLFFLFGIVTVVIDARSARPEGPGLPMLVYFLAMFPPSLVVAILLGLPASRSYFEEDDS